MSTHEPSPGPSDTDAAAQVEASALRRLHPPGQRRALAAAHGGGEYRLLDWIVVERVGDDGPGAATMARVERRRHVEHYGVVVTVETVTPDDYLDWPVAPDESPAAQETST